VLTRSFARTRHSRHCTEERYMPYVSSSWATLRLGQTLSNFGRSVSSTNSPLKANVRCKVWRPISETRTCMIQALTYMVLSSACFERCMTNAESYHSCQVRRVLTSSCDCLTNSTSKMTATSSPVYCTSRTDGSQKAMWKHKPRLLFKGLRAGNRTPQIWALSADIITSKLHVERARVHSSLTHIASLALRIASLKHQDSSTRRISQDLRSRKPAQDQANRSSSRTPTLSNGGSPMQARTSSPNHRRRTTAASAIPETPQRVLQSGNDRTSPADPTTTIPAIPEQLPPSSVSSVSQLDDDMQRRNSLINMVRRKLFRACSGADLLFS
jgi:hypothetical protein